MHNSKSALVSLIKSLPAFKWYGHLADMTWHFQKTFLFPFPNSFIYSEF